jgi:hypothetical protein
MVGLVVKETDEICSVSHADGRSADLLEHPERRTAIGHEPPLLRAGARRVAFLAGEQDLDELGRGGGVDRIALIAKAALLMSSGAHKPGLASTSISAADRCALINCVRSSSTAAPSRVKSGCSADQASGGQAF